MPYALQKAHTGFMTMRSISSDDTAVELTHFVKHFNITEFMRDKIEIN